MSSYQSGAAFFDHKRAAHGGSYSGTCETCRKLWEAYKAASLAEAKS